MALKTFTGEIAVLNGKTIPGRNGPITAWSAKVVKPDGEEYDEWVGFGFTRPECEKGDEVVITAKKEKGFWKAVDVEVTKKADSDEQDSESGETGTKEPSASSAPQGSSGGLNKDQRIQYQHSQEMAIQLANLLFATKALPLSATAGKAGEAARNEEVLAVVNKLTVQLHNDVTTGRLLKDVEDGYEAPEAAEAGFDGDEEEDSDSE